MHKTSLNCTGNHQSYSWTLRNSLSFKLYKYCDYDVLAFKVAEGGIKWLYYCILMNSNRNWAVIKFILPAINPKINTNMKYAIIWHHKYLNHLILHHEKCKIIWQPCGKRMKMCNTTSFSPVIALFFAFCDYLGITAHCYRIVASLQELKLGHMLGCLNFRGRKHMTLCSRTLCTKTSLVGRLAQSTYLLQNYISARWRCGVWCGHYDAITPFAFLKVFHYRPL